MQPRRPTSVLVIAIFHFILGGLGLLLGVIGLAGSLMVYATLASAPPPPPSATGPAAVTPAAQYQYLDAHLPYWKEVDLTSAAVSLVLSALMVVAGVGLLKMKPWGRTLSLVYGVGSILYQIGVFIYALAYRLPAM